MFPKDPLEDHTKWQCEACGRQVTGRQASLAQATLGRLLSIVDNRNVLQMERFLSHHQQVMPTSNQIVIEVKCNLVRSYGHVKGYSWTGELLWYLFNPLTPNDPYRGRTAPLTSKRCILYIYSTNICTEYFKYGI